MAAVQVSTEGTSSLPGRHAGQDDGVESTLEVSAAFRAEVLRRDTSASWWLDALPDLWRRLSHAWGLSAAGPVETGATSLVVSVVTQIGTRAALKLASPLVAVEGEAAALNAFGGHGAVTLLEADVERQAMLLEWLDGPALSEMSDHDAAMSIAGGLSRELASATPPLGAPHLSAQAAEWLIQLREQHGVAQQRGLALPDHVMELAVEIVEQLASDGTATLTHGDLSLSNILQADADRWVAIDPLLLAGTAANEAHTVVRSHMALISSADDPPALLHRWTRRFTDAAGVDHTMAHALSFARFMASYYWESQNRGATTDVARLRQAALWLAHSI